MDRSCRDPHAFGRSGLINELADYQPCTIAQWARLSTLVDVPQLTVLVRHLADMGLVAYA